MIHEKAGESSDVVALDTIVVPAHPKGFEEVFLGQRRWPNLKIDQKRKAYVRFIAVYQTKPVSAITHYVEVERFDPLEQKGRYAVVFKGEPKELNHVCYTNADAWAIQGPRYTSMSLLEVAKNLSQAFPK
jgi:hypothetical protein|tara:strand:+ start:13638 stop:14027 length:390 start_codon:yes stop_codon:yes gene_type:complete